MKIFVSLILAVSLLPAGFGSARREGSPPANEGFALVELFTSEGCSSCPSADRLLDRLSRERPDQPVYVLSYHVDYWNHLGWRDAYSDPAFTRRQRQYAAFLQLPSIYTPQVVVNGRTELVGSNEKALHTALEGYLAAPAPAQLTVQGRLVDAQQVKLSYRAQVQPPARLLLAFARREVQTKVGKGENGGKTLLHRNVVRQLVPLQLAGDGTGKATLPLPAGFAPAHWEVIAFLQHPENHHVLAATRVTLPEVKRILFNPPFPQKQ